MYSSYSFSTSTLMGWVVSITPRPRFTPGERTPGTHCTGGWVGPRAGLPKISNSMVESSCRSFRQYYSPPRQTQSLIMAFKTVRDWIPSWATLIQGINSHPLSKRFILILSPFLRLGFQSNLNLSGFPTKISDLHLLQTNVILECNRLKPQALQC
jgi:hypothetical protein